MPGLPVDIYCRVSRVGGREHLISPEEQERDARAFAKQRKLVVGEVLTDLDRSGGTLERPGLQAALERVRTGKSGGIVVAYLSRLTRETSQGLALIEEVREAGGDVYAPNLSDHTTADGRMLNTIQLAIDAGMRERAKEGLARARERAIANGIPVTNRPAVGYRKRPDRGYEIDPEIAPVIREVFERRAMGAGPTELALLLEEHGVHTSQGSATWSKQAVQNLINNRTYLGELRSGEFSNPSAHEPIVDEPLWLAAQRPNPAPTRRPTSSTYTLSGILRCKACGYCMQGTTTSRGKRIYRCSKRHAGGLCPSPARIFADVIEQDVETRFLTMNIRTESRTDAPDLSALEAQLERAEQRLAQALAPEAQDALGDRWTATVKERRVEREQIAETLGQARLHDQPRPGIVALQPRWESGELTVQEKREWLAWWFPAITVDREKKIDLAPDIDPAMLSRRGYKRAPTLQPL